MKGQKGLGLLGVASLAIGLATAHSASRANAEQEGADLLRKVEAKAKSLKGFACDVTAVQSYTSAKANTAPTRIEQKLHVEFARPNCFSIDWEERGNRYRAQSNGRNLFFVGGDSYSKSGIDAKARDYHWFHDDLLLLLLTGSFENAVEAPRPPLVRLLPTETWEGASYRVLEAKIGGGYPINYKLYVGNDLLVHRVIHEEPNNGRPFTIESSAVEIQPNPAKKSFAFVPATGVKENSRTDFPLRPGEFAPMMPGGTATDFELPTPAGGKLALGEAMKGSRAVLLNFWFVHCPPCRAEHPHLQKFYDDLKGKGLAVIAIDDQDSAVDSATYLRGAGLTFPVVLTGPRFKADPTTGKIDYAGPSLPDYASLAPYGVRECPTNILIDSKTGKVVYRSTAWDEAGLRKALKELGVG